VLFAILGGARNYGNLQDMAREEALGFGLGAGSPGTGERAGWRGPGGGGMMAWPLSSGTSLAGDPGHPLSRVQNILIIFLTA